jgi:hypothetical protein
MRLGLREILKSQRPSKYIKDIEMGRAPGSCGGAEEDNGYIR